MTGGALWRTPLPYIAVAPESAPPSVVRSEFREEVEAALQFGVRRDIVGHRAVVEVLVGGHVEEARSRESEDDGLRFAGLLALEGFIDGDADGVGTFGGGEVAFDAGELPRGGEDGGLFDGDGLHLAFGVQFGEDGAHAVVAEAAGMVGGRDEIAAERVHLGERADMARVAEVIGVFAAREARAGGGLDGDETVFRFAAELFAHERGDEAGEIGSAARAADDDVWLDAVFLAGGLRFKADDALMERDEREDGAEHVTRVRRGDGLFDGFGNGAAERSGRARMGLQDAASGFCCI